MLDLTHIIDFATQLPHPSDLGIIKPSGGFQLVPAVFGVIAIIQVLAVAYQFLANRLLSLLKSGWNISFKVLLRIMTSPVKLH